MSYDTVRLRILDINRNVVDDRPFSNQDTAYSYFCKQEEIDPDKNYYYAIYDSETGILLRGF